MSTIPSFLSLLLFLLRLTPIHAVPIPIHPVFNTHPHPATLTLHPPHHIAHPPPGRSRLRRIRLRHLLQRHNHRSIHLSGRFPDLLGKRHSRHILAHSPDDSHRDISQELNSLQSEAEEPSDHDQEATHEIRQYAEEETEIEHHESEALKPSSPLHSEAARTAASESSDSDNKTIRKAPDPNSAQPVQFDASDSDVVNTTHLANMVFKIIKQYKVKSLVDIPCRNTLKWFPALLNKIDFEMVGGIKYYCIDTDSHSQDDIRPEFGEAGSPEFKHIQPDEAFLLPRTDMVFSWDGPQQWGVKRTWAFFTALREIRPKYLLITNNPGVTNINDKRGLINIRKQPFHFSRAMRVISNVHDGREPKQLLLYELDRVRRGF